MILEVKLENLAYGGDAVGRVDGKAIFVPFGAPGDRARVRVIAETRRFYRSTLEEVIEAGPGRRPPPCPLFGVCGGCQWQHLTYRYQLQAKTEIFQRAMESAKVEVIIPPTPAALELEYRRRARLQWERHQDTLVLGYYGWRSKVIQNVDRCLILTPSLQQGLDSCREALLALPPSVGNLVAVAGGRGDVHISLRLQQGVPPLSQTQIEKFLRPPVVGGQITQGRKVVLFGRPNINLLSTETSALYASSATFTQANAEQERLLCERVSQWVSPMGHEILELYAGIGTISAVISRGVRALTVVESNPSSVELLRQNVAKATHLQGDAMRIVDDLVRSGRTFDVVVLDPPREGCPALCQRLAGLRPQHIMYISCDPMTLTRDMQILRDHGYHPLRAQLLDMMPQSFHLEGLVLLGLSGHKVPLLSDRRPG